MKKPTKAARTAAEREITGLVHRLEAVLEGTDPDAATLACAVYIGNKVAEEAPDQQRAMAQCMMYVIMGGIGAPEK